MEPVDIEVVDVVHGMVIRVVEVMGKIQIPQSQGALCHNLLQLRLTYVQTPDARHVPSNLPNK